MLAIATSIKFCLLGFNATFMANFGQFFIKSYFMKLKIEKGEIAG